MNVKFLLLFCFFTCFAEETQPTLNNSSCSIVDIKDNMNEICKTYVKFPLKYDYFSCYCINNITDSVKNTCHEVLSEYYDVCKHHYETCSSVTFKEFDVTCPIKEKLVDIYCMDKVLSEKHHMIDQRICSSGTLATTKKLLMPIRNAAEKK